MPMEGKRWRALREGRARQRKPDKIETTTLPADVLDTTLVSHLQTAALELLCRWSEWQDLRRRAAAIDFP